MPFVKLKIPILVQDVVVEEKPHYYIRPLFLNHPIATNRRFEAALAQFKKEIKTQFRGFIFNRSNSHNLLWYQFSPEITYHQKEFSFTIGSQYVSGLFSFASFQLQNETFIAFPSVNNFMFIAQKKPGERLDVVGQAEERLKAFLKKLRTDIGKDFNPEIYFTNKKEFITEAEINVNVGLGGFKFEEESNDWFFSSMNQSFDFDGSVEVEKVGYDLNSKYPSELRRAYYREELVEKVYDLIFMENKTPFALVGPEGVGKHTILHETVWRYHTKYYNAKKRIKNKRIWHIDPTRVISGMSIVGRWQKRFESIITYLQQRNNPNKQDADVMLVDNPVAMLRIGRSAQNNMTLSDVLKPYLEKRQLQVCILASPEEWKVIQEQDRRFSDLFQVIRIQEPSLETAAKMVLQNRQNLEAENECSISIQAVRQLFSIQRNYFKSRPLPGSIMRLLQQLATKYKYNRIDVPEVREEFKAFSGLEERIFDPSFQIEEAEINRLIGRELVGQPEAVETLSSLVHLIKAKLTDPSKPLSSFLFIGPTGVGKTQAAKVLCNYLMGGEEHLMRFDMNEFIDEGAVQRLIGDYYNPEGQLTGKVRYKPFGVLLLDEIEKAHPKVHDLLLQVLDDGRLTDSLGRTVDFSNTIIIMTSNVGAQEASVQLGFNTEKRDESVIFTRAVENYFRPEFINRIDKIVIFNPLKLDHILSIASLQIRELLKRDGFVRRTTILNISKDALEWVARRGFNARMGGRALKRQIERDLTTLSAEQLISTKNDNPIIFDILYEDDRLVPHINPLSFVNELEEEWLPDLPDETKGKGFYRRLLRTLEDLEHRLETQNDQQAEEEDIIVVSSGENLNWQYYHFKSRIVETKENIKNIMLGFKDRYYREAPAIPLRLKRGSLYPKKDFSTRGMRENVKDRLFQEEALKEITEAYQYAMAQFDSLKTEFIDNYLNVALLQLFSQGVIANKTEKLRLDFKSVISGQGDFAIKFLINRYEELFTNLDISYTLAKDKSYIEAEGYALGTFLSGESGIHLFYIAHQNPLPIKVSLSQGGQAFSDGANLQVIRIYDGTYTLTDLRTGFSNAVNITANEFKLLVYAGVNPEKRKSLMRF